MRDSKSYPNMSGKAVSDFNNLTNIELEVEKVIFKMLCHVRKQLSLNVEDSLNLKFTTQAAKKDHFSKMFFPHWFTKPY